ncbi:hypothetical protein DERP_009433 [Dermatophagoides pteronyssinus]|uniref:Uncharacterized protein n=1 Tax=Dermatophagoides pteronyssinus TaxID=6956 RepID=A0ABQ8IUW0_DERPT|nr:hypothetical protein DERP_009433 [Dermatophagoides pteronyssinus]
MQQQHWRTPNHFQHYFDHRLCLVTVVVEDEGKEFVVVTISSLCSVIAFTVAIVAIALVLAASLTLPSDDNTDWSNTDSESEKVIKAINE